MTIWIGSTRVSEGFLREVSARLRNGQTWAQVDEEMGPTAQWRAWLQNLPQGLRVIRHYEPQGTSVNHPAYAEFPSVTVIEIDDPAQVTRIVKYWAGYYNMAFHPYTEEALP